MKKIGLLPIAVFVITTLMLAGCSVVGGIFKAGMWTAIIGIVLLVFLLLWVFRRMS